MKNQYVLVDHENVRPDGLHLLDHDRCRILVFVGANQSKLAFEMAESLQRMGDRAQYVRISGAGRNALDFHIAFYVGQLSATDPAASFHVVSGDAGFDPLIEHLKKRGFTAARVSAISELSFLKTNDAKPTGSRLANVVENLRQRPTGRPRSLKTLSSTIAHLLDKQSPDAEVEALVRELQSRRVLTVENGKVTYAFAA